MDVTMVLRDATGSGDELRIDNTEDGLRFTIGSNSFVLEPDNGSDLISFVSSFGCQ
jgi:hypothetical protein